MRKTTPPDTEIVDPFERNTLEGRRLKLGLSRAGLASVFEVAEATVYRRERDAKMDAIWDWALKGIEAEYAERRRALGMQKSPPPPPTTERPPPPQRRPHAPPVRALPKSAVDAAVERAIARSNIQKR
jgi:DNA-binding XRE family transcriptional regulator